MRAAFGTKEMALADLQITLRPQAAMTSSALGFARSAQTRLGAMRAAFQRGLEIRATRAQLSRLSDRELADIGLRRSQIGTLTL
jgi:uncharacterized protein YjiS (DUF1127 family)